jgi:16S rRNA (uracil1498-N3)-methyltransferase
MSMRAFTPADAEPPIVGAVVELDDEESHYLVKVRRARVGDALELFDGRGGAWTAKLCALGRRARIEVDAVLELPEPALRVVLLGLPDQTATLEALTGAAELGATQVVLVACERSQGRVPSVSRIDRVVRAAQRQCGRPRPIELLGGPPAEPLDLDHALAVRDDLPGLFAWEACRALGDGPDVVDGKRGLRLLVGPEGGLSPLEVERIRQAGFRAVGLGPWVLRTETAVIAMLARFHGF